EAALEQCRQMQQASSEQRDAARTIRSAIDSVQGMTTSIHRNTESQSAASESVSEAVARILDIAQRRAAD
ncbi:MAG: hypothetical protein FJ091_21920, partial [Deltaproteobacteria bacterium]|nr:hypothetical protein [Deltaproteobacteria bacterium]